MLASFTWNTDPVIFSIGELSIRWYGLLFMIGVLLAYTCMKRIYLLESKDLSQIEGLFTYAFLGMLIGARIGHCVFYDPQYYMANPLKIIAIWEGGLASHGGAIGLVIGLYLFSKKVNESFIWVLDRLSIAVPLTAAFIRIGNFFNSEIIGIQTSLPWGVTFLRRETLSSVPRHPAQLYESFVYVTIFLIMIYIYIKRRSIIRPGQMAGALFILVFGARLVIEFIKIPQESYESSFLNTGQLLSIPFIVLGLYLIFIHPRLLRG